MIPAAAIYKAAGGLPGAIAWSIAVVLAVGLGVQTVRLTTERASRAAYEARVISATAKAAKAAATARDASHVAREAYYWKSGEAENAYQAGRDSAISYQETVVADLRSGNRQLRGEWAACMSKRVPAGSPAATAPEGQDGAPEVPAEAFGRVLRVGSDADNLTRWLQAELTATRELYSKCMVPKTK